MFSASALNDDQYDNWRDAEAAAFTVMERLRRGHEVVIEGASPEAVRRLGYLAEMTLLFLDAADPEGLRNLIAMTKSFTEDGKQALVSSVVPFSASRRFAIGNDEVAASWNIASGISLARFRAEIPALLAVDAVLSRRST
jgi:hypothetical protein